MSPFTEDEIKAKVQDGYIVESPDEMTEGYRRALTVQLTVQADTELISAPAYWMAARHAPSTNTQVSAHAIIQDELAHANIAYRLIKHGRARRVCFLVDRTNLRTQTLKEFQQFQPPEERHTFDRIYNTAFPQRNRFDPINRVVITTIQRLYSVLTNQPELAEEDEERSTFEGPGAFKKPPVPITYNPALPPVKDIVGG